MKYAPIAIFPFNRPEIFQLALDSLAANTLATKSHLTIFCDGPRNEHDLIKTNEVRKIANSASVFASIEIIERTQNMGPAGSLIDGIQTMFSKHEKLIVMEEDTFCSPLTLEFLNSALTCYQDNKQVFNISAWSAPTSLLPIPENYAHDVYAIPRFNVWGWASWRDRFESLDWEVNDYAKFKSSPKQRQAFNQGGDDLSFILDELIRGEVNTWDIRADFHRFQKQQVGINPVISYTTNIGMGSGTHTTTYTDKYDNDIEKALPIDQVRWIDSLAIHPEILKNYQRVYNMPLWHTKLYAVLECLGIFESTRNTFRKIKTCIRSNK